MSSKHFSVDVGNIKPSDITYGVPREAAEAFANLIIVWSKYENALTDWIATAFEMRFDATRIMVGNMETRNKIDKLIAIYKHNGNSSEVDRLRDLRTKDKEFSDIRNTIIHCSYMGYQRRPDGDHILFYATNKVIAEDEPKIKVRFVSVRLIHATIAFARRWAKKILDECPIEPLLAPPE